jgi:hypothetical protein
MRIGGDPRTLDEAAVMYEGVTEEDVPLEENAEAKLDLMRETLRCGHGRPWRITGTGNAPHNGGKLAHRTPKGRWDACAWPPADVVRAVAHWLTGDPDSDLSAIWVNYEEDP